MFAHFTDRELAIIGLVIAIFTIKPIPLFPSSDPYPQINEIEVSKSVRVIPATFPTNRNI